MPDNAWAERHSLRQVVNQLRARQVFVRPHCPWQNGKVQRLNRTMQREWAYRQVFTSNPIHVKVRALAAGESPAAPTGTSGTVGQVTVSM
jgi:transposase InsO family protein